MVRKVARAIPSLAAAAVLLISAAEARGSIVAPPDPAKVARLFAEACWEGLSAPDVFRRAVQSSPLRLEPTQDLLPAEHHVARRIEAHYFPGARCTIRASLISLDAAEEIIRRVSTVAPLRPATPVGGSGGTRIYKSSEQPVQRGRAGVELSFTPPPPRRGRPTMYPPAFILSISAYFTPEE
ncbi:MAG: hypothetical protein M3177_08725 [Pseudomonadota bacterium]|nr:hypothetical protein [Pseudomonadota bacterium]